MISTLWPGASVLAPNNPFPENIAFFQPLTRIKLWPKLTKKIGKIYWVVMEISLLYLLALYLLALNICCFLYIHCWQFCVFHSTICGSLQRKMEFGWWKVMFFLLTWGYQRVKWGVLLQKICSVSFYFTVYAFSFKIWFWCTFALLNTVLDSKTLSAQT